MSIRLLIGNLSLETTEADLETLFSPAGLVQSVTLVTDPRSNKKKGFAFVEMASDKEALEALRQLDGAEIEGRAIIVNLAEAQPSTSFFGKWLRLLRS